MDNKTQEKLQQLFESYSEKLPTKIHTIRAMWLELLKHFDVKKFETFHREVHTLTGSAATYGYGALSKSARELEVCLKALLGISSITKEQQEVITGLINKLESTTLITDGSTVFSDVSSASQSKLIYILSPDKDFFTELKEEIIEAGHILQQINEFSELLEAIQKHLPAALIIDTIYLNAETTQKLISFQDKRDIVIPLFCISSSGNITERLRAVRARSSGFLRKPIDAYYLTKLIDQTISEPGSEHFRILIVDDSPSLSEYYSFILQEAGMITRSVTRSLQALDAIIEFQPDLLLLDVYMPECSGVELAAILRQEPKFTHIPIIFLSSEDDKFKQLTAGGDDFLTKPILPQHLIAAVKSRAKRAGILSSFMTRDSLTGLLNHSNILHQLDVVITRAQRHNNSVVFAMIDIDNFKEINDKYGHIVGDRVLKKLSELLTMRLRKSDFVGRYGGEEFCIILTNTKIEASKKILDDLRSKFSQTHFAANGDDFTVTFSVGIAGYPEIDNVHKLIEAADKALYKAKKDGRNQIVIF